MLAACAASCFTRLAAPSKADQRGRPGQTQAVGLFCIRRWINHDHSRAKYFSAQATGVLVGRPLPTAE
jgi:hypothetical protein